MAELIVRGASGSDLPAVAAAYEWLFEPPGQRPPHWNQAEAVRRLEDTVSADSSAVLVADLDGALVGFCTLYLDFVSVRFGQGCWVEDLAVHPDHRSLGTGTRLMDAAVEWALGHGATHLKLLSADQRLRAHRFYQNRDPSWTARCFGWLLPPG